MTKYLFLFTISMTFAACTDPVVPRVAPDDVIYDDDATDEVWVAIDEVAITGTEVDGPTLTAPSGAIDRAGAPVTFTWNDPLATREHPRTHRAPSRMTVLLRDLFHPVAHAHEAPVTGDMYRLVFTIPGSAEPLRVLTGATTYTPDSTAWSRLTAATGNVSLELVHAYMNEGRVMDGPFRGPTATLVFQ